MSVWVGEVGVVDGEGKKRCGKARCQVSGLVEQKSEIGQSLGFAEVRVDGSDE